jgi:hypothetical protein
MNFSSLEYKFKLKSELSWNFNLQFQINQFLLYLYDYTHTQKSNNILHHYINKQSSELCLTAEKGIRAKYMRFVSTHPRNVTTPMFHLCLTYWDTQNSLNEIELFNKFLFLWTQVEKDTTLANIISPGLKLFIISTLSFSVARTSSLCRTAR